MKIARCILMEWILDEEDCYTFHIYDSGGTGICCESGFGYYKIKDNNGDVILHWWKF